MSDVKETTVDLASLRIDRSLKHPAATAAAPAGRRWGWWVGAGAIVVVAVLVLAFLLKPADAGPLVEVVRVAAPLAQATGMAGNAAASDAVVLNATGYIIAAHKIQLAPKVVGRVAWVGAERGDKVDKGQVLVRLEDDEYRARVLQAQGMLDAAKARLAELESGSRPQEIARAKADLDQAMAEAENASANVQRTRELAKAKIVSQQELDDAESRFKAQQARVASLQQVYELARLGPRQEQIAAQRAQVDQAQGGLLLAQADLANTQIRAPIAGTILERNVEVGEYVTTGFVGDGGAKGYVVSLADLGDLRVELDISQDDFSKVSLRQPCWVTTDAYPDRRYEGVVELISPEANRQKATVEVEVKILWPDAFLRPDMNASVAFRRSGAGPTTASAGLAAGEAAQALITVVPASAVRDGAVYVLIDGKAVRRAVRVGATRARGVEVSGGLVGGEEIIVDPPAAIADGQPVRRRTQEQP